MRFTSWAMAIVSACALAACASTDGTPPPPAAPSPAETSARLWVTTGDRSLLLSEQPLASPRMTSADDAVIQIDAGRQYQEIVGFGAAVTDASAWLIQVKLSAEQRAALLNELFGRSGDGLGFDFTRVTVGASDFSLDHYSLADTPDPTLAGFSTARMEEYVFPTVTQALAINPNLKVMASPWSAPGWMKTTGSMIKGELKPEMYPVYADYWRRYIQSAARAGVPTDYLSIQNEPDFEPEDYPGMRWGPEGRARFIGQHLGPMLEREGVQTRILDWDHNWDLPEQPLGVLADETARRYVSGVAWHCYKGEVEAQTPVRDAYPDKDVFFTECSGGEWAPDFADSLLWNAKTLIIGSTRNWSRGVLMWNLALDENHGPHAGGCGDCRGVVTINSANGQITRNQEYYAFGHASRFVRQGAHRVETQAPADLPAVAFVNPDDSRVLLVVNEAAAPRSLAVVENGRPLPVQLPARSVATLTWR